MKKSVRTRIALVSVCIASAFAPFASRASAAVTVTLNKSSGLMSGETISVALSGVPASQGVYVRQCYKPAVGLRDLSGLKCNGSIQRINEMIWATMDGARGSASALATLSLVVRDVITMYEADGTTVKERIQCGVSDCAVFVHRDHRGLTDTSLDTVVPLTFLGNQSVRTRVAGFPKDGTAQRVGAVLSLRNTALKTDQGVTVRVTSESPRVCSVSRGSTTTQLRLQKSGTCVVRLVAKATQSHVRFSEVLTYNVS